MKPKLTEVFTIKEKFSSDAKEFKIRLNPLSYKILMWQLSHSSQGGYELASYKKFHEVVDDLEDQIEKGFKSGIPVKSKDFSKTRDHHPTTGEFPEKF